MKNPWRKTLGSLALGMVGIMLASCDREDFHTYSYQEQTMDRLQMRPAKDAEEWLERLRADLATPVYNDYLLFPLYAELPPVEHWGKISDELDRLAGDPRALSQAVGQNYQWRGESQELGTKLKLFSTLLRGEEADVEPLARELLFGGGSQPHYREYALRFLMMSSRDPGKTLQWLKEKHPDILEPEELRYWNSESKKDAWEVALAEGDIDKGVKLLKEVAEKTSDRYEAARHYGQLMRIGSITGNNALMKEVSEQIKKLTYSAIKSHHLDSYSINFDDHFEYDVMMKNWDSIIKEYREIQALTQKRKDHALRDVGINDEMHMDYLTALVKADELDAFFEDIQKLQESKKDAPEEFLSFLMNYRHNEKRFGVTYLEVLKKAGRMDDAWLYGVNLIARYNGEDDLYEFLYELNPDKAKPLIDSIRKYDPYEERPLIWKAEIARREGKPEEAMKLIQEAIALDPSDGDHGKNSRMFCYEVLADIHKDLGNEKDEAFFRSVVDSIRQGEAADDFLYAGLIQDAVKRYEKALGQFEDAYCLQSRLALTLAKNGKFEEAVPHFNKAFELMPVSFGPRESHCFGCEGLFSDEKVVDIAVPLMKAFEEKHPDNPRAPYMLGLLMERRGEMDQAILCFERALELDPKYYNAATKLLSLLETMPKHYEKVKKLQAHLFEIAPYYEKAEYIPNPKNLRAYWQLASSFPPSPIELPKMPFEQPRVLSEKQFGSYHDKLSVINKRYGGSRTKAVGGWSLDDLCYSNAYLDALQNIN